MNKSDRVVDFWSVNAVISAFESGKLDLDTEYQRDIIWSKEKKQLLIDSILRNIDIPKLYLAYFTKEKQYECIDGKQRIQAIVDFYKNELGTESGQRFNDLDETIRKQFLQYDFSVSIISNPSKDDISELFLRVNFGEPLNAGEMLHSMRGDLRNYIFERIGQNGPFIGEVGIAGKSIEKPAKPYRFSREIAISQMIISSYFFRKEGKYRRARYEDIRKFLEEPRNKNFDEPIKRKTDTIYNILQQIEKIFGKRARKLNRKSVVVSAYLFCEDLIVNHKAENLERFPDFYLKLLEETNEQGKLLRHLKEPKKKILLERFQKNLQQASSEGYSMEKRNIFLHEAFAHYLKKGEIIGDE